MKERIEFGKGVREALARNAGYRCSFPRCGAPTVGPSEEDELKSSNTGMACHIIAAAGGPGARRVIPGTPDTVISSIQNGIWLCYKHGKIVDTDEVTYTVDMLRTWRKVAELRAKLSHEIGREVILDMNNTASILLPREEIALTELGSESELIGNSFEYSCIHDIWGDDLAHATRDVVIEITRNAISHGGSNQVKIKIEAESILVIDDGSKFDATSLQTVNSISGGIESVKQLMGKFSGQALISYSREATENFHRISLVRSIKDFEKFRPCVLNVEREHIWVENLPIVNFSGCETVYVVLPKFFALSDVLRLPQMIEKTVPAGRDYVVVGSGISERAIELLAERMPRARFVLLPWRNVV